MKLVIESSTSSSDSDDELSETPVTTRPFNEEEARQRALSRLKRHVIRREFERVLFSLIRKVEVKQLTDVALLLRGRRYL